MPQFFEPLRDEEYAALEADIVARGVQVAVEMDEAGEILDGHNRVEIADRHGIKYPMVSRKFDSDQAKWEHIIKLNLARRHLEPYQWGQAFKKLLEVKGIKYTPVGPLKGGGADTVIGLASELGVDDQTARRRMKMADVFEIALSAAEQQQVRNRQTTIPKVRAEHRKRKTKAKEKAAAAKAPKEKSWTVTQQQEMVQCDALITDPPYGILDQPWEPAKLESFTRKWAERWSKCGADFAAVFWSQRYLWDGRRWFDEALEGYQFQQLLVWVCPNNKSPQSRRGFKQTWEPIFFYRRADSEKQVRIADATWGEAFTDFDHHVAAVPQENFQGENMKQHPAQKPVSVMLWLINALTQIGELVCDPFCGSGTTGIAAGQLGRRFHGIDSDKESVDLARRRIATYGVRGSRDG